MSKCQTDWSEDQDHNIPFQSQLCQSFCLDDIIVKECGCAVPFIVEYDRQEKEKLG